MTSIVIIILGLVCYLLYVRWESKREARIDPRAQIRKQLRKMGYKEEWMVNVTYDFYKMFQGFTSEQLEVLEEWVREVRLKRLNQTKS